MFPSTTLAQSTPDRISDILSMSEWNDDKYKHLLKSGILLRTKEQLSSNIKLAENYGINNYITINYLKKSVSQNYALINYLLDNNIPLIENGKINSLFGYQPGAILKRYGIDLKQLMEIYHYEEGKDKNAVR